MGSVQADGCQAPRGERPSSALYHDPGQETPGACINPAGAGILMTAPGSQPSSRFSSGGFPPGRSCGLCATRPIAAASRAADLQRLRRCRFWALGIWGYMATLERDQHRRGLCRVPLGALAIWGWIELAFLTGVITGPNHRCLPAGHARNGNGSCAPGARSPITRCCWSAC